MKKKVLKNTNTYKLNKFQHLKNVKSNTAITLIALIITIIILLILAGVVLNMIIGDNGIIWKANFSKFSSNFYSDQEKSDLYAINMKIQEHGDKTTIASTEIITTKNGEVKEKYPIKGERIENSEIEKYQGLDTTIKNIENLNEITEENVELYNIDKTLISSETTYEYIINVKSGKLYYLNGFEYKGKIYYRPEFGIENNKKTRYKIKYNLNYETTEVINDKTVFEGEPYGTLEKPKRTNYEFDGWYTEKDGGNKITSTDVVTGNIELYAHWRELKILITADRPDGNNGTEVKITIDYKNCTGTQKYKIGATNNKWITYNSSNFPYSLTANTVLENGWKNEDGTVTISAQGKDSSGTEYTENIDIDLLDLDAPATPEIIANPGMPKLTLNGVITEKELKIKFDMRDDITNYYSIDNTNWIKYEGTLPEIDLGTTIYAKSVKNKSGLTISNSILYTMTTNALGANAYDGDTTTYDTVVKTKRLDIDSTLAGKTINIIFKTRGRIQSKIY